MCDLLPSHVHHSALYMRLGTALCELVKWTIIKKLQPTKADKWTLAVENLLNFYCWHKNKSK